MDNKGFISIEYLFSIFVILIITIPLLFLSQSAIESSLNMEDSVSHRAILDDVADEIGQVNSNGEGYSKYIRLPSNVGYYEITVENCNNVYKLVRGLDLDKAKKLRGAHFWKTRSPQAVPPRCLLTQGFWRSYTAPIAP